MAGRALKIHLEEGTATGLQTVEIDGWIGKVIIAPKPDLPKLLKRQELQNNALGVYVLVGNDKTGRSKIYVGQGRVANRLVWHSRDSKKKYWDSKTLVIVAAKGSGFPNPADCQYLESRLIELASKSSWSPDLDNRNKPALPPLSATDKTTVENFLTLVLTILLVLKIDFFDQPVVSAVSPPRFTFVPQSATAEMEIINSQFVVLKGSLASPKETQSIGPSNKNLRSQLRSNGSLIDDPKSGKWIFTKNVAFGSSSSAAGVVGGKMLAGTTAWKVAGTQQTYGDWDKNRVNAVAPPITGPVPTAGTTP